MTTSHPVRWRLTAAIALTAVVLLPRLAVPLNESWLDAPRGAQFHLTLWRVLVAAFLILGMRGLGRGFYRLLHRGAGSGAGGECPADQPWGGVFLALGAAVLALWVFVCGVIGLYTPAGAVLTFSLLLIGVGLNEWDGRGLPSGGTDAGRQTGLTKNNDRQPRIRIMPASLPEGLALSVVCLLAVQRGVEALAPPYSWDALTYHLAVPKRWLEHGGFCLIPLNIYSNMPMNLNLLYLTGMWLGDPVVAQLLHWSLGLGAVLGIVRAGRCLGSAAAGWAGAMLFLGAASVYYQLGTAFVDAGMAFIIVALIHLVVHWMERPAERTALLAAGLLSGFVAGCKYTGVYGPVALAAAVLVGGGREARGFLLRPSCGLPAIGLALAPVLPWLVKSAALTGNPVYPLLFDVFGGSWWSARQADWLLDWQRQIGMGRGMLDYVLLPWRVAVEAGGDYGHFAGELLWPAFALSPLMAVFWAHQRARVIWMAFWMGFVFWALGSQQIRFLIPLYPMLCLTSGLVLAHLAAALSRLLERLSGEGRAASTAWVKTGEAWRGRRRPERWQPALTVFMLPVAVLALRAPHRAVVGPLDARAGWGYVSQQINAREFLRPRVRSFEAFEWLESERRAGRLNPDSRIVMLFENMGLYCPLPWIADGMFEASWLANLALEAGSAQEFARRLRERLKPDLILVNGNILRDIEHGRSPEPGTRRTFADDAHHRDFFLAVDVMKDFLATQCSPVFTSEMNTTVYRLRAPPQSSR
ncbi:MAG: hypothetical protein Kow0059_21980 [Candidatus Sumerlaeia bacterium]